MALSDLLASQNTLITYNALMQSNNGAASCATAAAGFATALLADPVFVAAADPQDVINIQALSAAHSGFVTAVQAAVASVTALPTLVAQPVSPALPVPVVAGATP